MPLVHCFYTMVIAFLLCFEQISAACKTAIVDQSGHADFSTIQSAIDSVPSNNVDWYCINVNPGTYREKVKIPRDKPFILLKGSGQKKTMVVWNEPYLHDATFSSFAYNIVVTSMSFINSHWGPGSKHAKAPAVAAMECYIEGAVDFIFGNGQSIYKDCSIRYLGEMLPPGLASFITAQARNDPDEPTGFVFKNCNIYGKGATLECLETCWQRFTFAEYNFGPGADTSKRVKWMKNLDPQTLANLTSMSFINSDGWRQSMPQPLEYI
ncbi:hypothetical protein F3Y22_tig00110044pilonHSYRG00178 [Hibiscus syriacus]|uniref:Pectinesterase n=1 Tax=Hibiscus syriacus TaxID=106335 RepID=A0A6A3BND0_HIBSY|nr:hypothetical protein F3Y22_tig00110044pilonHSYRG00178 [Hibiscus syriacus]